MEKIVRMFGVTSRDEIQGFGGPFIMAGANTRVVRRSAVYQNSCRSRMG